MNAMRNLLFFLAMLGLISTYPARAQLQLTNLPANTTNQRFLVDVFPIVRPGLSIRGFDGASLTGGRRRCSGLNTLSQGTAFRPVFTSVRVDIFGGGEISFRQSNKLTALFSSSRGCK
jgi:hypothetical protein